MVKPVLAIRKVSSCANSKQRCKENKTTLIKKMLLWAVEYNVKKEKLEQMY